MQYNLNLKAGVPLIQQTGGPYFLLMSIGVATVIDVEFFTGASSVEHVLDGVKGLKARLSNGQRFDRIRFTSAVDCTIKFIVSDGAVDLGMVDGANVFVGNTIAIPVSNDRGSAGNPVFINGTIAGSPPAVLALNTAPVAMSAVIASIVAANANRVSLRLTNVGANPVAIGAAGLTFANGAVILQPGDMWIEERACNLAWFGICGAALASTIAIQEITA